MIGKSKNLGRMGPRLWNQLRASPERYQIDHEALTADIMF